MAEKNPEQFKEMQKAQERAEADERERKVRAAYVLMVLG